MPTYGLENASSPLLLLPPLSYPQKGILCQNFSFSSLQSNISPSSSSTLAATNITCRPSSSIPGSAAAAAAASNTLVIEHVLLFAVLLTFCLATVLGNILVVLAVIREPSLHTATNYFITSLAVADCLVGKQ